MYFSIYILSSPKHAIDSLFAADAAKAVNYKNVGTIEFLVDKDQKFYFMVPEIYLP